MQKRKILVTGISSIHGWPIFQSLRERFGAKSVFGIRPPSLREPGGENTAAICLTDTAAMAAVQEQFKPDQVIHAGGMCDLDAGEAQPELAKKLNVESARTIIQVFSSKAHLLYISADLVFSGKNPPSGGYQESDLPDPVSVIGRTFLQAEQLFAAVPDSTIVRIGLPMGPSFASGKGALGLIRYRLSRGLPMTLFYDEWRSCIVLKDLAGAIGDLAEIRPPGLFHLGGSRAVSLYEIGEWVVAEGKLDAQFLKKASRHDDVNGPPRIGNVHLNSQRIEGLLGRVIPAWG